jgi:ABC-2 type transport system ATP-binding protein
MNYLKIDGVSKHYSNHVALDSVSFSIPKQSIFGLLGPNGAGKTSLIRIINQITQPDSGSIHIDGEELNPGHIAKIGYLPEERGLYTKMKVWDQLMYFARLRKLSKKDAEDKCNQMLERFEASDWKKKKVEELSKGMQQKIQFIITVMHEPDLIILDEPFTGFDPINTQIIKDEIVRLRDAGATIIFSTHRMESVEEICDRIGMIHKSKKVLEGSINEVKKNYQNGQYRLIVSEPLENPMDNAQLNTLPDGNLLYTFEMTAEYKSLLSEWMDKEWFVSLAKQVPSIQEIFIQNANDPVE